MPGTAAVGSRALTRLVPWLLARVPLGLANGLAWAIAWIWWTILPIRRGVAVDNLRRALPDASPRRVLTRAMHDIALSYVEIFQLRRLSIEIEGELPPGSLLLAGHGGAWDLSLLHFSDRVPLAVFLKVPADAFSARIIADLRAGHGLVVLEPGRTMGDAYDALATGRTVMFIQDQRHGAGIESVFFGRPARTSAGFASAVLRTGRPAYAVWQWREGVGRHRIRVEPLPLPPPTGDRDRDVRAITDAANAWYEARIRECPHGWLWLHRRWR